MPAKALVVAILGCLTRRIMCGRTIARVIRHCIVEPAAVIRRSSTRGISPLGVCLYRAICQRAWLLLPRLLSKTWIRYGRNPGGTQRLQCQYCKKVWTPKQHALNAAETPEQICSIPLLVPFQGANAFQQLYFYSVLTLFAAMFFTFPAISRYFLPERVCITTGKELRRPRVRMAILFTVSPLKNGNFTAQSVR